MSKYLYFEMPAGSTLTHSGYIMGRNFVLYSLHEDARNRSEGLETNLKVFDKCPRRDRSYVEYLAFDDGYRRPKWVRKVHGLDEALPCRAGWSDRIKNEADKPKYHTL